MMKEKKGIMKKLFFKSFFIELDEVLMYLLLKVIILVIEGYVIECNERLKFESKVKLIIFYLENVMYCVEIKMVCGGYYIFCIEV